MRKMGSRSVVTLVSFVSFACGMALHAQDGSAPVNANASASAAPTSGAPPSATPAAGAPSSPTAAGAASIPQGATTFNDVLDRVVQREHLFMAQMRHMHPMLETYLQNLKPDSNG